MTIYQNHKYTHGVGWSMWHLQWVTKYRHNVFADPQLQKLCVVFLHEAAERYGFAIEELEVDVDHVHIVASLRPSIAPARAVQLLKGYSSRLLFLAAENQLQNFYWNDKKYRSVWGAGKFMASVGHITLEKAKEYVRSHHAKGAASQHRNPHPLGLGSFNYHFSELLEFPEFVL